MARRVKKAVKSVRKVASATKSILEREIRALIEAGLMTRGDAKKLLKEFVAEVRSEKERLKKIAEKELKKHMKHVRTRAKPLVKKAVANYRKARAKKTKKRRAKRPVKRRKSKRKR